MTRNELINIVKLKLDEYSPDEFSSLPYEDYISPLLDESAKDIVKRGPLRLLTPTNIPLGTVLYKNNKSYIPVPSDYVRLYEIKYPLWEKSVREAISPENPLYKIQENIFTKGGYSRPCVSIIWTSVNGEPISLYFECSRVDDPGAEILLPTAAYVKITLPEDLNDQLADSLTWLCVSKIYGVLGYGDKASFALRLSEMSLASLVV